MFTLLNELLKANVDYFLLPLASSVTVELKLDHSLGAALSWNVLKFPEELDVSIWLEELISKSLLSKLFAWTASISSPIKQI